MVHMNFYDQDGNFLGGSIVQCVHKKAGPEIQTLISFQEFAGSTVCL